MNPLIQLFFRLILVTGSRIFIHFCADPLTSSNVWLTSVKDWTTFIALSSPSADQIVEALFNGRIDHPYC